MTDQSDPCGEEKQYISPDEEEAVQISNNDNALSYYFLKPTLLSAFSLVGAIHKQYTFKEILSLLKAYIFKTKAFDPKDERFVICSSSDLGKAFGVDRFEYSQVRNLISQNLVCTSNNPSCTSDMEKKVDIVNGSTSSSQYFNIFKIHVPNVPDFQSGPESEYSYQEYDTAVCKDSDCNVDEESEQEEIEYELQTEPETDAKDSNSESDVESIILIVGVEDSGNSDEDCFADGSHSSSSSSSSSTSDTKESSTDDERDKWACVNCGIRNKPFMRYCLKCWDLRKDWYPDPPKRRRKRKPRPKKDKKRNYLDKTVQLLSEKATEDDTAEDISIIELERTSSTASSCTVTSTSSSSTTLTTMSQDSGFSSQDLTAFKVISLGKRKNAESEDGKKRTKKICKNDNSDSVSNLSKKFKKFSDSHEGKRWLKSSNAKELIEKLLLYSSGSETEEAVSHGNCTLCYSRPKNASIVHGRLSHIGFCYPCAKRLYNSKAKCPICRRKIHMITKNSYV